MLTGNQLPGGKKLPWIGSQTMKVLEPANQFVTLPPSPEGKITWKAPPADFVKLVILTGTFNTEGGKVSDTALYRTAKRYCKFINIDFSPWPDFRSFHIAQKVNIDFGELVNKTQVQEEEFERFFVKGEPSITQPFSPFIAQAIFHCIIAKEFAKRWGTDDWESFSHIFNLLFITPEMLGKTGW